MVNGQEFRSLFLVCELSQPIWDCYIAIKPSFSIGHNGLGEALAKQGKLVEAVDCFRKAVELNSNYPHSALLNIKLISFINLSPKAS